MTRKTPDATPARGASRRTVLKGASALAALALAAPAVLRTGKAARADSLRVRRNASTMSQNDPFFTDYAEAVRAMHDLQTRSPDDQRNWRQQALIHLNHCPHGLDDFFAWHRNFITFYEEICGALIGKSDFALAYWDWTAIRGRLPAPFFADGPLNVTYWNDPSNAQSDNWGPRVTTVGVRALSETVGLQDRDSRSVFTPEAVAGYLRLPTFPLFWRAIEGNPHNTAHTLTGGFNPTGHMSSGMSPLDPIFWLHHCNVDRLWAQWQNAGHTTPNQPQVYNGQFVNAAGDSVNASAAGAVDFRAMGFTYDTIPAMGSTPMAALDEDQLLSVDEAPSALDAAPSALAAGSIGDAASIGAPASARIPVEGLPAALFATRSFRTVSPFAAEPVVGLESSRILLELSDIETEGDVTAAIVNVSVNDAPAGAFGYFMPPHGGAHGGMKSFIIDATDALQQVAEDGRLDPGGLDVTITPQSVGVSGATPKVSFRVGKISVLRI